MRRIRSGPVTVQQALGRGLEAMLEEDRAEAAAADPFAVVTGRRRRTLLGRLLRGGR
jgi:hypothetical protein